MILVSLQVDNDQYWVLTAGKVYGEFNHKENTKKYIAKCAKRFFIAFAISLGISLRNPCFFLCG
jgi:hypothetical protein